MLAARHIFVLILLLSAINSIAIPATDLNFIENKGQITDQHHQLRNDLDVKIESNGVTLFIGNGEMHYQWTKASPNPSQGGETDDLQSNTLSRLGGGLEGAIIYRMDVVLVGADKNVRPIFEESSGYYEHYYLPHTGKQGVTAKGYQKITYKNIYPDIDWVLYIKNGRIKYDFIVHPRGDVNNIQIRYGGATDIAIEDGQLIATTPFGRITENAPYSYCAETGTMVESKYRLRGNTLGFETAAHEGTLVIDPSLEWATYYGGTINDFGVDIATDLLGNVYLLGRTLSTNIATTGGAHQVNHAYASDAFVVKFNDSGTRKWCTYYGGNRNEYPTSITTDRKGDIYFGGHTTSDTGIATTGSHEFNFKGFFDPVNTNAQYGDCFFVKMDSSGSRIFGTYYGNIGEDRLYDISCDLQNNIYICGHTGSAFGIATVGSFLDTNYNTGAFLAKFNSNGVRQWGTYYGENAAAVFLTVGCDAAGSVYAGGQVNSNNVSKAVTAGAHQTTAGSANQFQTDGLLVKFSSGGQPIWGTLYGGLYTDDISGVVCDDSANIYIAGHSASLNNIASANGYDTSGYGNDVFVAKFDSAGTRQWGTYYGESKSEDVKGITIGADGNIYVSGATYSDTLLSLIGAHQYIFGGGNDAFLAMYSKGGKLQYSTYYGGSGLDANGLVSGYEEENGIAAGYNGKIYMAATSNSTTSIAAGNAHQNSLAGNTDAYVAAFITDTLAYILQPYTDTVWCPGDTVKIPYGVNTPFVSGNTFTVQLSDTSGEFSNPVNIGSLSATLADTITCVIPLNSPPGTKYRIRIVSDTPTRISQDNQVNIRIKANPDSFYNASNSPVCTGDTLHLTGATTSSGVSWAWSGPNSFTSSAKDTFIANSTLADSGSYILTATLNSSGCSLSDTVDVEMRPTPNKPTAGSNSPVCETKSLQLTGSSSTSGVSYGWAGPTAYSSSAQSPTVTSNAAATHAGDYILTTTLNGCTNRDTTTVVVLPKPTKPTAAATNSPLCQDQNLLLTGTGSTGGATYNWYGPAAFTSTLQNPIRYQATLSHAGTYFVYTTLNGCVSDTDSVAVVVNTDPEVNVFPSPGTTICQGKQVTFTTVPVNAGTATYAWLVNGLPTATGTPLQTTSLNNGDVVQCVMTSIGTCATPFYDTSMGITMTVQQLLAPQVNITADPNHTLFPNEPVTFTATPTDAGSNPTYQWRRNGMDIGGATSAVWGANANALSDGDEICAIIYSSYACPNPDTAKSNCITVQIKVGVDAIAVNNSIRIYPNPVGDKLFIEGIAAGTAIELYDVVGRKVYGTVAEGDRHTVNTSRLAKGNYILKLSKENNVPVVKKVVKE